MARADGATNFFGYKKITSIFCCCCVTLSGNIEGPVFLCVIYNKWGWNDSLLLCMSKLSRFEIGKKGTDDWQITQSKASFLLCFFFSSDVVVVVIPLEKRKKGGRFLTRDQKHDDDLSWTLCCGLLFLFFSTLFIYNNKRNIFFSRKSQKLINKQPDDTQGIYSWKFFE